MAGKNAFHNAALAKESVPPSIIEGVISPPYAPAASASNTASHFSTASCRLSCQPIKPPNTSWLPAFPLPSMAGNQTDISPMRANDNTATAIIRLSPRARKGNGPVVR